MKTPMSSIRFALALALAFQSLVPGSANAEKFFGRLKRVVGEAAYHGKEPPSCKDSAIEYLAKNIDWLEHHLDAYGSIVCKQPDIWGEARLTKHRDEYERVLFQELGNFDVSISAAISQGDSAFLSQALALSAAASETGIAPAPPQENGASVAVAEANAQLTRAENPSQDFTRFGISASNESEKPIVSLEPVIQLDQLSRYLQHLHELRRINEGDDTSDSPGYSLNLVRIPVSILPGKLTRTGFGAEVTVTVTPVLSEDLLPTTFRNLVINDVVDQLGLMLVKTVENYDSLRKQLDESDRARENSAGATRPESEGQADADARRKQQRTFAPKTFSTPATGVRNALLPLNPTAITHVMWMENLMTIAAFYREAYDGRHVRWNGSPASTDPDDCPSKEHRVNLLDARRFLRAELAAAYELLSDPDHVRLFAKLASPSSGLASAIRGEHFYDSHGDQPSVTRFREYFFASLHNHSGEFQAELDAAVQHLSLYEEFKLTIEHAKLSRGLAWYKSINADTPVDALAWMIVVESALLNQQLNGDVRTLASAKGIASLDTGQTHSFFLPAIVNHPEYGLEDLQASFLEASQVFQDYVRARWPIHVFAIDPREQDQNVADVSQRKRELQFALALGFATGKIGGNSLTQFSRQLETQVETIGLNRTIVGFGHGHDTFGWRFHPRVQALAVPGTLGAIRETIMGTPRDYDLRQRQLEPGQRECIALVLMPSFVPYADFDVRTNWFKLTNPKNAALTMKHTMRMSRAVTAMRNSRAQCARCQHLYREGELSRLFRRVDQLDRELPLQTLRSQVPYENTLGGFEMFNTGVTDLAPELIGWYGAPGVVIDKNGSNTFKCGCTAACSNGSRAALVECTCGENNEPGSKTRALPACEGEGTSLFLVGDNFSVHDTRVIAGGVCIPHVQLISREIIRVTIPSCVNTVSICENDIPNDYVAVYVATPYGITNHLHVPTYPRAGTAPNGPNGEGDDRESSLEPIPAPLPSAPVSELRQPYSFRSRPAPVGYSRPQARISGNDVALRRPSYMLVQFPAADPFADPPTLDLMSETELSDRLAVLEQAAMDLRASAAERPAVALAVNVQPPIINAVTERAQRHKQPGPIISQMKTSVGEHWRNLRDNLPGQ